MFFFQTVFQDTIVTCITVAWTWWFSLYRVCRLCLLHALLFRRKCDAASIEQKKKREKCHNGSEVKTPPFPHPSAVQNRCGREKKIIRKKNCFIALISFVYFGTQVCLCKRTVNKRTKGEKVSKKFRVLCYNCEKYHKIRLFHLCWVLVIEHGTEGQELDLITFQFLTTVLYVKKPINPINNKTYI